MYIYDVIWSNFYFIKIAAVADFGIYKMAGKLRLRSALFNGSFHIWKVKKSKAVAFNLFIYILNFINIQL